MRIQLKYTANVDQPLSRIVSNLNNTDKALQLTTHAVAKYWQKNFRSEGALIGGWAALADATVENRLYQGYGGAHPIMIRSGGLMEMSTTFFATADGTSAQMMEVPYDSRGIYTMASVIYRHNQANLAVVGPQVFNHYPGIKDNRPARPIWFVNRGVMLEAGKAIDSWVRDAIGVF